MEKFRNFDWLRAVQLIPNSANLCYHILAGEKPSREKQIWRPARLSKLGEN